MWGEGGEKNHGEEEMTTSAAVPAARGQLAPAFGVAGGLLGGGGQAAGRAGWNGGRARREEV